ncbi:MAG: prepilin-type N-terminal cleavage/methylation domain-containing protein [Planctomycetota bacterium]
MDRQRGNEATRRKGNKATRQRGNQATRYLGGSRPVRAFSLAEMMIALIILGFGLLVVGAALPVGFWYTQKTVDQASGDAATAYALDTIERYLRLCRNPLDALGAQKCYTDIFRPRYDIGDPDPTHVAGELARDPYSTSRSWEPLIKVRPLMPMAIIRSPGGDYDGNYAEETAVPHLDIEQMIREWVQGAGVANPDAYVRLEYDNFTPGLNWLAPGLPSVASVYPPITADTSYNQQYFFNNPYATRPVSSPGNPVRPGAETLKALERRIAWTAFYRRVSYATGSDSHLYEIIAVATRLPSEAQRYPRCDPSAKLDPTFALATDGAGSAVNYNDRSTLLPVPWLVTFLGLPVRDPGTDYDPSDLNRTLYAGYVDPPTLTFIAPEDTGVLLPVGSIFIPAVNDRAPTVIASLGGTQWAGFVPHAPDSLPIYEVVERIHNVGFSNYSIIVKNNGLYPWINGGTVNWPVWIIPPAFKELSNGLPVYEDTSPIVAIDRRIVRLPEVP